MSRRTDRGGLAIVEVWKDTGVQQSEKIPFSAGLGLKVPEDETLCLLLIDVELCIDVVLGIDLLRFVPTFNEIDLATGARARKASRIAALPSRANFVAIETWRTVCHCRGPFTNDYPMIGIVGI